LPDSHQKKRIPGVRYLKELAPNDRSSSGSEEEKYSPDKGGNFDLSPDPMDQPDMFKSAILPRERGSIYMDCNEDD
jgi:hypothetical protein